MYGKIKATTMLAFAFTLGVLGASNCIVSGDLTRPATHSADSSASPAVALDVRGGSSCAVANSTTAQDGFEARAWSCCHSTEVRTFNCLPPAMIISFR